MNLPDISVKRPVTITMILLILMVMGLICFTRLGLDFFPDLQFPEVSVITTYPGASSEEMETLITRPLEESVSTVSGVRKVKSSSREGVSLIQAELDWGSNLDLVAQDARNMMDIAYDMLPDQVERPLVVKTDFDLMPVLYYGVLSKTGRDLRNLRKLIEDQVEKRIETLPGVAAVTISGGLEREILVEVDRSRLEAHNLSLDDITRVIRSQNRDIPGGHITQGTREFVLRTIGKYTRPDHIAGTIIKVTDGKPVYVRDVATVIDGHKEVRNITRTNRTDSLIFWVTKESGANTVNVVKAVRKEMKAVLQSLPPDIDIIDVWDTSKIISDSVKQLGTTVRWGGLITMVVLFAFLASVRTTLTLIISIPFAIITTFIGIYFAGYTLNLITLSGLALGVGMIVDNSVVVLENIFRHLESGEEGMSAARKGATEVSTAITASTLTSVIVFVPLIFATGLAGEMTKPLGLTVTFALFASLLVAQTLVPMLSSRFLARIKVKRKRPVYTHLAARYQSIISFSLRHRFMVVAAAFVVFFVSIGLVSGVIKKEYMPKLDEIYTTCVMKMAPGTSLEETIKFVTDVENALVGQPEFKSMISLTGLSDSSKFDIASGAGPAGVNESEIFFEIAPKDARSRTSVQFLKEVMSGIPDPIDGTCYFMQTSDYIAGGGERPIVVNLFGPDLLVLKKLSDNLEALFKKTAGIDEVDKSLRMGKPELKIDVDREKASLMGITAGQVADTVDASFLGRKATKYREAGDEYDIRVRFSKQDRLSLENIDDITIPSPMGFQ
ncbi:MAG: efflux RND transporter permease subunit, partial [Deltaproteobacteria bacterium]|nr:efflux RND transporter permease subunit [Deltaproteobacteria bacterium]